MDIGTPAPRSLTIDCDTCVSQHSSVCDDCIVSFVCDHEEGSAVVVDVAEFKAMRALSAGGLVPRLRHRRRTG